MHDGAQTHHASDVRDWFDENFPARWIGRRSAIDWPARSPDLTLGYFFLWEYLKEVVYKSKPRNLSNLKQSIIFTLLGHQFEHSN